MLVERWAEGFALDNCCWSAYYRSDLQSSRWRATNHVVESNLHSPERRLIELRMEHADLDALIDAAAREQPLDELMLRRLKKRRLALRDLIVQLEGALDPKEPA